MQEHTRSGVKTSLFLYILNQCVNNTNQKSKYRFDIVVTRIGYIFIERKINKPYFHV